MTRRENRRENRIRHNRLALAAVVLSGLAAFGAATGARADQDAVRQSDRTVEVSRSGPADDEVVLELREEAWVETDSATVRIAADLAVEGGGFGAARSTLEADLAGFVEGAAWRIVDFQRRGEDSGFERWRVVAEARVPESVLADLPQKTDSASAPGRALSVAGIDYTPTLAEREATLTVLRTAVYARVAAELSALRSAFPDREFRVRSIQMAPGFRAAQRPPERPAMLMRSEAAGPMADQAKGGGLAGAEKARLGATVVLAAPVGAGADRN